MVLRSGTNHTSLSATATLRGTLGEPMWRKGAVVEPPSKWAMRLTWWTWRGVLTKFCVAE
jgi:hypothetical protein